jgi:phosphatidylglycerol---prolipoprotein diacylglyceryl transferase
VNVSALVWHQIFETMALVLGARYYAALKARAGESGLLAPGGFAVAAGCLLGAAIGNKAAFWLQVPDLFLQHWREPLTLLIGGQSVVGGLVGGLIGVELAKKLAGVRRSTGDRFVFPLLLGIAIGRIGCFIAGLQDDTFGIATTLPWGVDFGDGVRRHPTQLYEIVFCGVLAAALYAGQSTLADRPGLLFKLFLSSYLAWRLAIDGLKPAPFPFPGGLSGIQWLCLLTLLLYLPLTLRQFRSPAPASALAA